ncbi:Brp/Blh family beta-carotene 15,15'-dioxygenase [Pelagibacterales bacterium SAG-MED09]|nr:Brp/Blh family beta-carotene 15,15'-dioxygenase [Pelagibacterales bacterium SAG-MED09]
MNSQIKKINLNHSFIFFLLCNIFSIISFKITYFTISPLICLFLILIIGVSHGSLDNLKGKKLFQIFGINNFFIFYLSYILVSLIIIFLWIIAPSISLIIFLIVASHHFGKEDTQFLIVKNSFLNQLLFFLKGSLVIFAPMYFHFDDTISIFKLLLIDNEYFYGFLNFLETNKILFYGIILSTLSSIILFTKDFELKRFTIFLDYFSILIINYYFSPLVAFTIYFCFLHSVRHSISLMSNLDKDDLINGLKIFTKKALPLTILTAIFCFLGLYLLNNTYSFDSSILKIIFIGLASLTFPHILLEYLIEKNEK